MSTSNYLRILSVDDPADKLKLARKAKRVTNPQSTEVILGIQRMKAAATAWEHETNRKCEGLAAPQIGWNARVIIVRVVDEVEPKDPRTWSDSEYEGVMAQAVATHPHLTEINNEYGPEAVFATMLADYDRWKYQTNGFFDPWEVMINPTIKQVEGERKAVEGCLSVPHGGYEVTRPTHVAFKYIKPNGKAAGERRFIKLPNGRKVYLDEPNGAFLAKFTDTNNSAQVLMHEIDHCNGKCIADWGLPIIGGGSDRL